MRSNRRPGITDVGGEDSGAHAREARSYPRKRASIACATCRARKTRCDGAKPRCSFCEDLDIDCQYQRPAENRNPDPSPNIEDILHRVEHQLHRIEASISIANSNPGVQVQSPHELAPPGLTPAIGPTTPSIHVASPYQEPNSTPSQSAIPDHGSVSATSSRIFRTEWPDLEYFESLPPLNTIHYDDAEDHTYCEIQRGENFARYTPEPSSLDLSPRIISLYQTSFVRNVLSWIPLFDQRYMVSVLTHATESGFGLTPRNEPEIDLSSALGLLILALGAISNDDENVQDEPAHFAGVDYFVLGFQRACYLGGFGVDILGVQCYILSSLYFLYTTRQFQACQSVARASYAIPVLFRMKRRIATDHDFHQLAVRSFWACYVLEYELTGKLSTHLASLSNLLETMHLPSSEYEDLGSYFFASAIALRRLMSRVMDLVRYSGSGTGTIFAPIIALELHKQLSTWYSHLPPMLRFPLDPSSPVLDGHGHKAFLRAQYFSILAVTNWTFVLRILDSDTESDMAEADLPELAEQAGQCLQSAMAYIATLESLMAGRHLMLGVHLKGLFTISVMLCSVFRVPRLSLSVGRAVGDWREVEEAVERAVSMMDVWKENSGVAVALCRLRGIMRQVGMRGSNNALS